MRYVEKYGTAGQDADGNIKGRKNAICLRDN
jgi:hypothetical protein